VTACSWATPSQRQRTRSGSSCPDSVGRRSQSCAIMLANRGKHYGHSGVGETVRPEVPAYSASGEHSLPLGDGRPLDSPRRRLLPRSVGPRSWADRSLALALSIFTGFTQFVHPLVDPYAQVSPLASSARSEIYLVDADGAHHTRLTISHGASDASPAFSADGAFVVFTRSRAIAGRDPVADVF